MCLNTVYYIKSNWKSMVGFYILEFLSLIIYSGLSQFFYGVLECNQISLIVFWKTKMTDKYCPHTLK